MARKRKRSSARDRAEKRDSERSGSSYLKLPSGVSFFEVDDEGPYTLDFLCFVTKAGNPYAEEGQDHFERTFYIHKGVGPNNSWVICPKKTAKKACPVCEDVSRLRSETDDDDEEGQKAIKMMLPKERQLFVLRDTKSDNPDNILVWDFSFHMFGKQLEAAVKDEEEEAEAEFFACAEGGSTLRVGFDEKSFNKAKYYETRSVRFKKRADLPENIADDMPCLDDLLVIQSYDQLKSLYMQELGDDDDEKKEDKKEEKPKRGRGRNRKKEEKEPEPEKDDDGWGDEEETKKDSPEKAPPEEEKKEESEADSSEKDDEWDDDW